MKVIKVKPRGYCKGVVSAINIAKETVIKYPNEKIYILGMLVHNRYVKTALNTLNVETLDTPGKSRLELLDEIDSGVVIFTAHGVSSAVKAKAIHKGLKIIDASCSDVLRTQSIINNYSLGGYDIIYIGKKGHPEAMAVTHDHSNVHLVENVSDINALKYYRKVFVTNQTTMSIDEIASLMQVIKAKYPYAIFSEEICDATRMRQTAIKQLANQGVDVLFIVGDSASNNSNRLADIGRLIGIKSVYLIDDVNDLGASMVAGCQLAAVSSGASTPTYLTNQVIEALENDDFTPKTIDITAIL